MRYGELSLVAAIPLPPISQLEGDSLRNFVEHIPGTPATAKPRIKSLVTGFIDNPDGVDADEPMTDKTAGIVEAIKRLPSAKGRYNRIFMEDDRPKHVFKWKSQLTTEQENMRDASRLVHLIRESLPQLAQSISKIGVESFQVQPGRCGQPTVPVSINRWDEFYQLLVSTDMVLLYKNNVVQFRGCFVSNGSPDDFFIYPVRFWKGVAKFQ